MLLSKADVLSSNRKRDISSKSLKYSMSDRDWRGASDTVASPPASGSVPNDGHLASILRRYCMLGVSVCSGLERVLVFGLVRVSWWRGRRRRAERSGRGRSQNISRL